MYENRTEAGEALAKELQAMKLTQPVVFALPRGGVPVALPVAEALGAPLDLILVRKIGVPGQEELAAGAMVDGPPEQVFFNTRLLRGIGLKEADFTTAVDAKRRELAERRQTYLAGRAPLAIEGRDAILIDDGVATGATVRAALLSLGARRPARIILAVPVAAKDALDELRPLVDRLVCPQVPAVFRAVGLHYQSFNQVSDDEVCRMMASAPREG